MLQKELIVITFYSESETWEKQYFLISVESCGPWGTEVLLLWCSLLQDISHFIRSNHELPVSAAA